MPPRYGLVAQRQSTRLLSGIARFRNSPSPPCCIIIVMESSKHIQWFDELDIDKILAEESAVIEEVHTSVEQNGVELSEAELLWNHFRRSKE